MTIEDITDSQVQGTSSPTASHQQWPQQWAVSPFGGATAGTILARLSDKRPGGEGHRDMEVQTGADGPCRTFAVEDDRCRTSIRSQREDLDRMLMGWPMGDRASETDAFDMHGPFLGDRLSGTLRIQVKVKSEGEAQAYY